MGVTLTRTGPGTKKLFEGLKALKGARVLVGIPQADNQRFDDKGKKTASKGINNAEALFIFSKGSPLRGQPPRPVMEPAIQADGNRQRIARNLAKASKAALHGDQDGMVEFLDKAGTVGESASKRWFRDSRNGWPANAPSTVRAKLGKLSAKKRAAALQAIQDAGGNQTGIVTPGIDTGQMRRAITHVLDIEGVQGSEGNSAEFEGDEEIEWTGSVRDN